MKRTGFSIVSLIISSLIGAIGLFCLQTALISAQRQVLLKTELVIATHFATELLEFFRALTPDELKELLSQNPTDKNQDGILNPYSLCTPINILDRESSPEGQSGNPIILNEDPLAALPNSKLDLSSIRSKPNRFYYIQIVNLAVRDPDGNPFLFPRGDLCNKTVRDIYLFGRDCVGSEKIQLGRYDRFMVTVGVSWVPPWKSHRSAHRVVLSSLIVGQ